MNEFGLYLVKSAIWLSGFAMVYLLFLRNERYFVAKRIFLVTGILASLIFPLFTFHYDVAGGSSLPVTEQGFPAGTQPLAFVAGQAPSESLNYRFILFVIYLTGIFLIAARVIYHLFKILITINRHPFSENEKALIIRSKEYPSSFSFFNYVFINPSVEEDDFRTIINHELVHIRQKHWFDLVLIEVLRLFQWVNPFVWIYTRFIRLNHEYLADEAALKKVSDPSVYKVALLNQMFRAPAISLSNSFTYSLNENRFKMMKKIITSPYRKLKMLLILPVMAVIFYSFAEPVIQPQATDELTPNINPSLIKEIKGLVLKSTGEPFAGVSIAVIGTDKRLTTDAQGRFTIPELPDNGYLMISSAGYLSQMIKPKNADPLTITLQRDPDYAGLRVNSSLQNAIYVIDGVVSETKKPDIDPAEIARMTVLNATDAKAKYGEKGKDGAIEVITKKNAEKFGIRLPVTRTSPDDYPTFQGDSYVKYAQWLTTRLKYPAESVTARKEGRVTVTFTVQADGSVDPVTVLNAPDKYLGEAVEKAVRSGPKWDPAKNTTAQAPFFTSVTVRFELPDRIMTDNTFVVVEQMPEYPGGSAALLSFIKSNMKYPAEALSKQIEGRVIVRFIITAEGNLEDATILKSIHPLLDAEALRVINRLTGWLPGTQGGKPVNVYYMVPVNFSLNEASGLSSTLMPTPAPLNPAEQPPIFPGGQIEMFKAVAERTQYPEEAKTKRIQGRVIVKFVVAADGKVKDPVIAEGVDPLLDKEALRVVGSLPDFTPGTKNGKAVDASMTVPITFTLK